MATASIATQRIKREFKDTLTSEEVQKCGIKIELKNDSWSELLGEIAGTPDTPYEGGNFKLEIVIPENYPFLPPKVRFITKIWHPNISSVTGAICLDVLKDQWAAGMTLRVVLLSLQALLAAPEPDDPQDAIVARQFKGNSAKFRQTAEHWTAIYAGGTNKNLEFEALTQQLVAKGVEEMAACATLSYHNWDLDRAIKSLVN